MAKVMTPRRIVVTGVGMVTPVGIGSGPTWDALLAGESGAGELTLVDHQDYPVHFGCEIKGLDPADWMDKREVKRVDRFVHFAMASTEMCMRDSGLDMSQEDATRCGVVFGSGIGGVLSIESQYDRFRERGPSRISPFMIPLLMINCAPGTIAIRYGFKAANYGPVTACATGTHSISLAMNHIRWGEADVMLAGASEAGISVLGLGGFCNMKALSTRNEDPEKASRPFDKDRDGFVMGEGSGTIMLEELEHAKARGAKIYAEVCGYGMTDDAYHITAPEETGSGGTLSMKRAMEDAGITPDQVDYINAHGTSTLYNDKTETLCIKQAFGEENARKVSISSTKGSTGHLLGAAGAVEAGLVCLAIDNSIIPQTINYTTPDPECDLNYTPNEFKKREIRYALSNSLGFGGHNCTLCFGRYEG